MERLNRWRPASHFQLLVLLILLPEHIPHCSDKLAFTGLEGTCNGKVGPKICLKLNGPISLVQHPVQGICVGQECVREREENCLIYPQIAVCGG